MFDGAGPVGDLDVDGADFQAVALRVFDQHRGRVEAHGLVVEDGGGEGGEVFHLEIGRGVGDEREAGGVGLGESVEGEGADGLDDFVLGFRGQAVGGHAGAELDFEVLHALPGAAHADGAAQLFGFGSGEIGDGHGDAEELLLKERDAEGALEHGLERRVRVGDRFPALAAAHIRMHHFSDDGAGADDGDLDDEVVEAVGAVARERGHLRAAFDLEHADGVGALEDFVDFGIFGEVGEVDGVAVVLGDEGEAIFEDGHHAEAEEVDFDDAEVGAVFLIPLDDGAAGHGGALEGDDVVELALADDHAAGVLAEVAREILEADAELEVFGDARVLRYRNRRGGRSWPWCRIRRATPTGRRVR